MVPGSHSSLNTHTHLKYNATIAPSGENLLRVISVKTAAMMSLDHNR